MTASFLTSLFSSGYPVYSDAMRNMLRALFGITNITPFVSTNCATTVASTSNTNITNATQSFTKQLDASKSDIFVIVSLGLRCDTASRQANIALNDGTTDRDVAQYFFNTAGEHQTTLGGIQLTTAEAKAYTFQLKMRNSGTGTLTIDVNDTVSMIFWEGPK